MLPASISRPFKRAALGLFHGKSIQHGNNVPHSLKKTRRTWLPNVHPKTLESAALGRRVQVQVTARALRTIHKHGGLDTYLLRTSPSLLGDQGMRLRLLVRERLDAQNAGASTSADTGATKRGSFLEGKGKDRTGRAGTNKKKTVEGVTYRALFGGDGVGGKS